MKIVNFKKLVSATCITTLLSTSLVLAEPLEIEGEGRLFVPHGLAAKAKAKYSEETKEFTVELDGVVHTIKKWNVRDLPKDLTSEQLSAFLQSGYLSLGQVGEEISLTGKQRLLGGIVICPHGKNVLACPKCVYQIAPKPPRPPFPGRPPVTPM
jgi:hypothetical protein